MRIKTIYITLLIVAGISHMALSQSNSKKLSRKEKKEWKKRAKKYAKNPQALKQLVSNKDVCEKATDSISLRIENADSELSIKNKMISDLTEENTSLRQQLSTANDDLTKLKSSGTAQTSQKDFSKGIVFRVQIGAFQNKDLSAYFNNNPNFFGEATEKGSQVATIGVFRKYEEADLFKKYMREMGVRDAWIVPYQNGQRVKLNEVLSALEK